MIKLFVSILYFGFNLTEAINFVILSGQQLNRRGFKIMAMRKKRQTIWKPAWTKVILNGQVKI